MRVCPHRIGEQVDFHTADNPNDLWPQTTWQQDTSGTFAMASSSAHALGSTGGSETHTLTESEMPAHKHRLSVSGPSNQGFLPQNSTQLGSVMNGGPNPSSTNYNGMIQDRVTTNWANTALMENVGGGSAHSVLNPYRAVNRWKRVA